MAHIGLNDEIKIKTSEIQHNCKTMKKKTQSQTQWHQGEFSLMALKNIETKKNMLPKLGKNSQKVKYNQLPTNHVILGLPE